jgi:hypothetical protein
MRPMIVGALGVLLAGVFGVAQAQEAQQVPTIDIPINTVVDDAPPFEQHILATMPVDPADQGKSCEVTVVSTNQESVHPGNNLVIASNGSSVTAFDVEREPGAVTEAVGTLVLGPTVTVELFLGLRDHVFSAGLVVSIDCIQVSPEPPVVRPPVNPPVVNPPAVTPPSPASSGATSANPATADIAVAAASVVAPARFTG